MTDIPIGTNNKFTTLATQYFEMIHENIHETQFLLQYLFRAGTRWHVQGYNAQAVVIRLHITTLGIRRVPTQGSDHFARLHPTVQSRAAIALLDGVVVVTVITLWVEYRICQLVDLCLGFLDTNDIRILLRQPVKKTLSRRRPNAIGVHGNNSGH